MPNQEPADIDTLTDLQTPWCVHVVATLRIAELIDHGVTDVSALAEQSACDAGALQAVLLYLVGKGVFVQPAPGTFALNDSARGLLDPGRRLGLDLDGIGGRMAFAWGSLLAYVRTGRPYYQELFGLPFWEDLQANPEIGESFDALMGPAGHGAADTEVLVNHDWESIRSVVDVGGGSGTLLAAILRDHPGLRGTLIDLPSTVARSDEVFRSVGVSDRVKAIGQSFFEPLPPGADLYILQKVLSDWPDLEALLILRRCAEAAHPNGRIVIIIGGVSPDETSNALVIEMILVGGKNRTLVEFQELANQASLAVRATGRQPGGRFVLECAPA